VNETHDPLLRSWVESANDPGQDFPLQNLPFGVIRPAGGAFGFRGAVAIGDSALDLQVACALGLFEGPALAAARLAAQPALNALMAAGPAASAALRLALSRLLRRGAPHQSLTAQALLARSSLEHSLPASIGDYTDFYTSIHHATAVGRMLRPEQPLMPNYRWLPVGYHGRSSSIGVSSQHFPRPFGQRPAASGGPPSVGPSERLDYELELGVFIGNGNGPGTRIPIAEAESHVFGLCLLNDWSARDLQAWEYQPLGPFLGKNFATTVSPWIVTLEALEPFRVPWTRDAADTQPLEYLEDAGLRRHGAIDLQLEVWIETAAMRAAGGEPVRLSRSNYRCAYWSMAQMIAHHTINGCNLRPGDLLGTGTQSGPAPEEAGSLLELTRGGRQPLTLPDGQQRGFLQDGDEVILRGHCERPGAARVGLGEARGRVLPAQG
jgi:fumarylacetoacetase